MSIKSLIVAMDENHAIGKDQSLLWQLPNDMKFFKETTSGHTVIMGRKTFESLPKGALPNRRNIILSNDPLAQYNNCTVCNSLKEALDMTENEEEIFIIGGGSIYEQALPLADSLYITTVHHMFDNATVFFPDINWTQWTEVNKKMHPRDDKNPYPHTIRKLVRLK